MELSYSAKVCPRRGNMDQHPGGTPNYPYPVYPPPPAGPPVPAKRNNTIGLIALIVSVIGFVFACVPGALIVGWVLLPMAFILGIVGLFLSGKTKGTSIAAVIVSIIGTVVGVVVFMTVASDAFKDAFHKSDLSASSPTSADASQAGGIQAGSRENPLSIGETVTDENWNVALGAPREAVTEVAAENQFNDPPKPGMQYWIVPITATYTGDATGNTTFEISVKFVGADNRTYDDRCGVIPNPLDDVGALYKGGKAEGNACVAIPAGAEGLWTVSTGLGGKPVFFVEK
jgi:hypothetical protein